MGTSLQYETLLSSLGSFMGKDCPKEASPHDHKII